MYNIVALVGMSGSGKDRILRELTKDKTFHEIISNTTRPMRENEKDGVNYHYLTKEEFLTKQTNGEMLEVAEFRAWYYGTSYDNLSSDKINIGVYNPTGLISLLENNNINVLCIKVDCSNKERVIRQLNRENNPDVDEIIRRYSTDKEDFNRFDAYLQNNKIKICTISNDTGTNISNLTKDIKQIIKNWENNGWVC